MEMFSYDVSISPSPADIDLTVAISGTEVQVTVTSVPSMTFLLTPSGNLLQKILSAIAWPISELIGLAVKDKPKNALEGQIGKLGDVPSYTTHGVVITPSSLTLDSADIGAVSMVKITASLSITAA